MTDNELRGLLLRWYYERRREHWVKPKPEDLEADVSERDIAHVTDQLQEHGLIKWSYRSRPGKPPVLLGAQIKASGVDVVEGTSLAPIAISERYVDNREYHITGADNVQAGDHNVQHSAETNIEHLHVAIQTADVPEETKEKAEKDLETFANSPAVIETLNVGELSLSTTTDHEIHD